MKAELEFMDLDPEVLDEVLGGVGISDDIVTQQDSVIFSDSNLSSLIGNNTNGNVTIQGSTIFYVNS